MKRGDRVCILSIEVGIMDARKVSQIEECLKLLLDDTGANSAMLIDKSGEVVASQGKSSQGDIEALAALLAGTFTSSREVARLLKEKDFSVLFQKGIKENIFTELIKVRWMLVVMFDKSTHIGLVKVLAKRATDELTAILKGEGGLEGGPEGGGGVPPTGGPDGGGGGPLGRMDDWTVIYRENKERR
jgi:predicted regulator of Ras-like GTPase activity (Roadblock/LC7/MglB family)